jgi:hypothetical protein
LATSQLTSSSTPKGLGTGGVAGGTVGDMVALSRLCLRREKRARNGAGQADAASTPNVSNRASVEWRLRHELFDY